MSGRDILVKIDDGLFSYRVAGILIRDGMVLLQHPLDDPSYAFPGGHVNFGEVSHEALVREFKEEVRADITPIRLLWVIETFFAWGEKPCHQIGLYFLVALSDETQIPLAGCFTMPDKAEMKISNLEFCWIPLSALDQYPVYPLGTKEKLADLPEHIEHWVYIE